MMKLDHNSKSTKSTKSAFHTFNEQTFYKLTIGRAIYWYHRKRMAVRGLLYAVIVTQAKLGKVITVPNIKDLCVTLGISQRAFYKAKAAMIADGEIGIDIKGTVELWADPDQDIDIFLDGLSIDDILNGSTELECSNDEQSFTELECSNDEPKCSQTELECSNDEPKCSQTELECSNDEQSFTELECSECTIVQPPMHDRAEKEGTIMHDRAEPPIYTDQFKDIDPCVDLPAHAREEKNAYTHTHTQSKNDQVITTDPESDSTSVTVEVVTDPEPETKQTDTQDKQASSIPEDHKKHLGGDQGSAAPRDNKVFGISVETLEEISGKFDRGEISRIPDRELKALAELRIGKYVRLYRRSGLIHASNPNDIDRAFAKWLAWSELDQESDIQHALNIIGVYEENPAKWQVLAIAVEEWQKYQANPELMERKATQRTGKKSTGSEIDKAVRVRKLEQHIERERARRAAKEMKRGNVPAGVRASVKQQASVQPEDSCADVQPQHEEQAQESAPIPDDVREKIEALKQRHGGSFARRKGKPSIILESEIPSRRRDIDPSLFAEFSF